MRYVLSTPDRVAFVGSPVRIELSLVNDSDREERVDQGFGDNNMHGSPVIELLLGEVFSSWGHQALPAQRFVHHEPIVVGPGRDELLGMWNLAEMTFIEATRASGNPRGYLPFWKVVKKLKTVRLRWSDGVFQRRAPACSNELVLELRSM
jgi:hypothetical protein